MPRNKLLKSLSAFVLLLSSQAFSQAVPSVTQAAKNSSCSNIVALAGDVKVDCSNLTPAQQKLIGSIPELLHKIIANQLDPQAVMAKLDEILHAVNPNLPTKIYFCRGGWRTEGPGPNVGLLVNANFGDDPSLQEMIRLADAGQNSALLEICTSQLRSKPEWLTPRLFCAIGYARIGDQAQAKEMLDIYDARKGPAYTGDDFCRVLSDLAHSPPK